MTAATDACDHIHTCCNAYNQLVSDAPVTCMACMYVGQHFKEARDQCCKVSIITQHVLSQKFACYDQQLSL